jgi:thiol-disulfide isomerase/thioredoxin
MNRVWVVVLAYTIIIGSLIGCSSKKVENNTTPDDKQNEVVDSQNKYSTINGKEVKLADYQGKVVFMSYWATWCKPCIKEMPSIEAIKRKLPSDSIVFLMVSDESITKIESFIEKNSFTFDFIKLDGEITRDLVYALPTTHIYSKKGVRELEVVGARDWDASANIEMLLGLIKE